METLIVSDSQWICLLHCVRATVKSDRARAATVGQHPAIVARFTEQADRLAALADDIEAGNLSKESS
jgi:hypothetical protein